MRRRRGGKREAKTCSRARFAEWDAFSRGTLYVGAHRITRYDGIESVETRLKLRSWSTASIRRITPATSGIPRGSGRWQLYYNVGGPANRHALFPAAFRGRSKTDVENTLGVRIRSA